MAMLLALRRNIKEEPTNTHTFVICLFHRRPDADQAAVTDFLDRFVMTIRNRGGNIHLRCERPELWDYVDGRHHRIEPNHLNPAAFDFDIAIMAGFESRVYLHNWWASNEVFELLKSRECLDKMGVFRVDGMQESVDYEDRERINFGDRIILLELIKMDTFKPVQQYVDLYKKAAMPDSGVKLNLLASDGVNGVMMNEYTLDFVVASSWKGKPEVHLWYDSETFQNTLLPIRTGFCRCLSVLLPLFEEKLANSKVSRNAGITVRLKEAPRRPTICR